MKLFYGAGESTKEECRDIGISFIEPIEFTEDKKPVLFWQLRARYEEKGYKVVYVFKECSGVTIIGYGSEDKDGEYFIPMHNMRALAVDKKVELP